MKCRFDQYALAWDTSIVINVDGEEVRFFHTIQKGVHRVFVDHHSFLAKVWGLTGEKLYGAKSGADFIDNQKRFSLFCKVGRRAMGFLSTQLWFVTGCWLTIIVVSSVY